MTKIEEARDFIAMLEQIRAEHEAGFYKSVKPDELITENRLIAKYNAQIRTAKRMYEILVGEEY